MSVIKANASGKPGKPVAANIRSLTSLESGPLGEWIGQIARAAGLEPEQVRIARETYERAIRQGGAWATLFIRLWQEKMLVPLPADSVIAPWATGTHQRILALLRERGLLPSEPLRLPCRGCGRLFWSEPPRFARSCGCQAQIPTGARNPAGSAVMRFEGFYPAGPFGPSRGQSVLCAHPDCTRLFLSHRSDRRYCDEHRGDREAIARARARAHSPKHTRFRFRAAGSDEVRMSFFLDGHERSIVVGPTGYQARDAEEFFALVQLAASGRIACHAVGG